MSVYKRARDLAGEIFPVSENVILQIARRYGIGKKFGRVVIFSDEDVYQLYEVLPCVSNLNVDQRRLTGSSAAPSAESELRKALELATGESPKRFARNARPKSSPNQSTAVALPQRLRMQP